MSSESSRFQHLLQPIRDLSKNWNIDLAQELEEYLDELEHLTIAFDQDGVQRPAQASARSVQLMNFAEAALLIQGTSMIYSRKVEYLYALVFQTLAHLSKQQGDSGVMGGDAYGDDGGGGNDDGSGDDGENADGSKKQRRRRQPMDVFANPLPIFDELEEARNITLKKPAPQAGNSGGSRRHGRPDMAKTKNNIQASIALMGSLVPDERDHGETFKLLSCHLHPSGVLLMDEASKKYLKDEQAQYAATSFSQSASQRLQATPMAKLNFDGLDTSMASDGHGGDDDDDDDNNEPMEDAGYDIGGGEDAGEYENPGPEGVKTEDAFAPDDIFAAPIKPEPTQEEAASGMTTPTKTTATRGARAVAAADVKDPWAPLDAYDASKSTVRPFRKGRSYPVRGAKKTLANKKKSLEEDELDGVDDPAFKERFLLSANRPQWSTWVWNDLDDKALETRFKKKYCKSPCLMTSCESLWRLETKWKSLMRKCVASEEQSANAILLQEQAEEEEEEQMHAMTMNSNGGGLGMNDAFVSDPVIHDVDGGDDDDDDDDGDVDHGLDYDGGGDDDWGQNTSGFSHLDNPLLLKNGGLGQSAEEQDGERALSYEEICRQHLEDFMKGTEKYIRETDLTRQVNDWQDKLSPILREQDAHPPFDIHRYGRDILGHLETSDKGKKAQKKKKAKRRKRKGAEEEDDEEEDDDDRDASAVPFSEVVGGLSQFEVCRMFLASLQLANNGNVQLHHAKTAADQARVPFEMELLTTSNVYESLQHETAAA